MKGTRRNYLAGIASTAGLLTVTPTGEAREHNAGEGRGPPEEVPPRKGDSVMGLTVDPIQPVRVGIIGLGNRGSSMVGHIDAMYPDKGEINAICDLVEDRVEETLSGLQDGQDPTTYSAGVSEDDWDGEEAWREDDVDKMDDSWKEMVERDDLDLIFIFTHHRAHAPMAKYAMEQGKHVATEVPAATTIKECWELVNTAEKTQRHCMMLENVNYFEYEMWVLNMVKNGVFGDELSYASGAYIDNQLGSFLHDYGPPVNWRGRMHYEEKGDIYPTHGLGPIAWSMDILRGDRFEYIVSQESPATRFPQYCENELDPDHEFYGKTDWENGDTTRSLIKTNKGKTIENQLDEATNRPYSRIKRLSGVDAYVEGHADQFVVDGEGDGDEVYDEYWEEHRHELWSGEMKELAEKYGGHGGGDFLEIYRLFDALNHGRPLDMDVYDAVTWSAVRPLSAISIEHGSKPVKFPDFTRGEWEEQRELEVMKSETI